MFLFFFLVQFLFLQGVCHHTTTTTIIITCSLPSKWNPHPSMIYLVLHISHGNYFTFLGTVLVSSSEKVWKEKYHFLCFWVPSDAICNDWQIDLNMTASASASASAFVNYAVWKLVSIIKQPSKQHPAIYPYIYVRRMVEHRSID